MTRLKALYCLTILAHVVFIVSLPVFPSQDGPSHVYGAAVLRDLLTQEGKLYGWAYEAHTFVTPNLGAILPLYGLLGVLPAAEAEKVLLVGCLLAMAIAVPHLNRLTAGDPYWLAFFVFPIFFSRTTTKGFYAVVVGMSLWLWATWVYWHSLRYRFWVRWVITTVCSGVLFLCHLLPFACFALSVAVSFSCPGPDPRPLFTRMREIGLLLILPAGLLTLFVLRSLVEAQSGGGLEVSGLGLWSAIDGSRAAFAVANAVTLAQVSFSYGQIWSGLSLSLLLAYLWVSPQFRKRPSRERHLPGSLQEAAARRWFLFIAGGLLATMLVVPDEVGELSVIKSRFPPFAVLALLPAASSLSTTNRVRVMTVVAVLAVSAFNAVLVARASFRAHSFATDVATSAVRGHFVAGIRGKDWRADPVDTLRHMTSGFCARLGCVNVGDYQGHSRQFFVRFRPSPTLHIYPALETDATRVAWADYPGPTYVLGWELSTADHVALSQEYELIRQQGSTSLWRRIAGSDSSIRAPDGGAR